jgi:glycosyltransferase involved in cell wall biosynthesis
MKIEVYAICYNEEVMLPYFLRHYSQIADKIVIYDNYSTDRSDEICRQNPKVELIKYDSGNQIRDDIYLEIKNNCWKKSTADWVIVCDIDELLVQLQAPIDLDNWTVIMPDWFEMVSDRLPDIKEDQIYYDKNFNQGVSQGQISKCIMFRPAAIKEINYHPGAHGIAAVGDVRVLHTSDMGILHYKHLSLEYVIQRHKLFGQRLSEINKINKWGVQYEFSDEQTRTGWHNLWDNRKRVI